MVYETNPSSGYSSFGDYITECPGDLKAIFDKAVAVPYYTDSVFGPLSRAEILRQVDDRISIGTPTVSDLSKSGERADSPGSVVILANAFDATASAQAKNLEQCLRGACPALGSALSLQEGEVLAANAAHFIIFLTDRVFENKLVCQALDVAKAQRINVVFVAEADERYGMVGLPLMGGPLAPELVEQAPELTRELLTGASPIPFYGVKLFRDASIAQIVDRLYEHAAQAGSGPRETPSQPEHMALIKQLEAEKVAALAAKDEEIRQLKQEHARQLQAKDAELIRLRAELASRGFVEPEPEPEPEGGHELPQLPPRPAESEPEPEPEPAGELSRQPTFDASSAMFGEEVEEGIPPQ